MITVNNRDRINWFRGITVQDIFDLLGYKYTLISVHIDEDYVSPEEYGITEVPDGSEVWIMHLAHGG